MKAYQCRRCESQCDASFEETHFIGRVVCAYCGGTCDPTPKEAKRIQLVRQLAGGQYRRAVYYSAGFGTNQHVGRAD